MRLRRRAAHIAHCSVVTGAATEQASDLEEGKRFPYCLLGRVPHERRSCLREAQLHDLPARCCKKRVTERAEQRSMRQAGFSSRG